MTVGGNRFLEGNPKSNRCHRLHGYSFRSSLRIAARPELIRWHPKQQRRPSPSSPRSPPRKQRCEGPSEVQRQGGTAVVSRLGMMPMGLLGAFRQS